MSLTLLCVVVLMIGLAARAGTDRSPPLAAVTGRLTDADSGGNGWLELVGGAGSFLLELRDGALAPATVPVGRYRAVLHLPGREAAVRQVELGRGENDLALRAGARR